MKFAFQILQKWADKEDSSALAVSKGFVFVLVFEFSVATISIHHLSWNLSFLTGLGPSPLGWHKPLRFCLKITSGRLFFRKHVFLFAAIVSICFVSLHISLGKVFMHNEMENYNKIALI